MRCVQLGQRTSLGALIDCGDRCLEYLDLESAMAAYAAAQQEIAPERLEALGDRCLASDNLSEAIAAYRAAKSTLKLISLGDHLLERRNRLLATVAYSAAGASWQVARDGHACRSPRRAAQPTSCVISQTVALRRIRRGTLDHHELSWNP